VSALERERVPGWEREQVSGLACRVSAREPARVTVPEMETAPVPARVSGAEQGREPERAKAPVGVLV